MTVMLVWGWMSAGNVGGTRIVSSTADVLRMSVVRGMRGVGGVCEGVSGWEDWVWALPILWEQGSLGRVFGLRSCGWWGWGLGPWSGGLEWCYVCVSCESGFSV